MLKKQNGHVGAYTLYGFQVEIVHFTDGCVLMGYGLRSPRPSTHLSCKEPLREDSVLSGAPPEQGMMGKMLRWLSWLRFAMTILVLGA